MKVLLIADCDPRKKIIGGIGIYSLNLVRYLTSNGIKVVFFGKKQDGDVINRFDNFDFVEINNKANQSNYFFLKNLFKAANNIHIENGVIIHAQRPDWLIPFAKKANKKIITLHGSHSKNVSLKKGFIIGSIYLKLEKKGFELADKIISVSQDTIDYYKRIYQKNPEILKKFIWIPNGIDLNNPQRTPNNLKKSGKMVIYLGRFEKEKNLPLLIESCHKAKIKLLLIGSGREEENLKKLSQKLGSDTLFHEPVDNSKVPALLSSGDVLALTSLYEGFPTVALEAFALGIPVVSTDVGDMKKLVENGKTGFIVSQDDIVEKLKIAVQNPLKYRKNCIKKAQEYSWTNIGNRILNLYLYLSNKQ